MGPVTALAGVCLQDVEGAHEGGKRLLASRLRPVSSKATHPPTYLPLHTGWDLDSFWVVCVCMSISSINFFSVGGTTSMDPQISPWGGYFVGFGAIWARLPG